MSHSTEHIPETEPRQFPALKVMERQTPPLDCGVPPFWRAPLSPASAEAYIPAWTWMSPHDFPEGEAVSVLEVNAGRLAALQHVRIAHSQLVHTGEISHRDSLKDVAPGYYRITVPYWAFDGTIVSPLGDSARLQTEPTLWVAAPTLELLLELEAEGHLGAVEIVDSWTATIATDFHAWFQRLCSLREECLDRLEMAQTETRRRQEEARCVAFEDGCAAALAMMIPGQGCATRRPDWAHTVYAQQAADAWRLAWRYTFTGRPLVALGTVGEMAVLHEDVPGVLQRPEPPFTFDATGHRPGTLRQREVIFVGCEPEQLADSLTSTIPLEEIL